jgi:hypothetical protein
MSYKQNASSNRDALFGSATASDSKKKQTKSSKSSSKSSKSSSSSTSHPTTTTTTAPSSSKGYQKNKKSSVTLGLTGEAKETKLKEAQEYVDKAKKAMQKGLFARPDPLAASTYYKRAADSYQQCSEFRKERYYRIGSADAQRMVGAWATAAAEYTRAAELVRQDDNDDDDPETKRDTGRRLLEQASECWLQLHEPGKAAAAKVQAALALTWGDDSRLLPRVALAALEEAVEAHVPDPLNPHCRYRQTGVSAFVPPGETPEEADEEALHLAEQHVVTRPYAHESVQDVVSILMTYAEYPSALYAQGAVSALLERDGVSSLTLSRSYLAETVLTLAMGDPVAAEQAFLNRHVQKTSYLSSRECKLAEELFRAVKVRDGDALEEARDVRGSNRSALGNLPEALRDVVAMLRLSGVARRGDPETHPKRSGTSERKSSKRDKRDKKETKPELSLDELAEKSGYEEDVKNADDLDANALQNELDALDFGDGSDGESDLDDDDIDLR